MDAAVEVNEADASALQRPFLATLVRLLRAEDTYGAWEGKSDEQLLRPFVVTKEERRAIPIMGDPEPEVLWRLDKFYVAIGLCIEQRTGVMTGPMMKLSHEGFGRVVLIAGQLIGLSKHLRDVHRFGFDSFAKLATEGDKVVKSGVDMIEQFPEAANY